jgi:hypothetical protein
MKHYYFYLFITLYFSFTVNAQTPNDILGYTPLEPRLLVLNHKVDSDGIDPVPVAVESFTLQTPIEAISIYTIYQINNGVGKSSLACWSPPPPKLMDLYIIYKYYYLIPFISIEQCNKLLPTIILGKGDELTKMKVTKYYLEKGKIKNSKIGNKQITTEIALNELSMRINKFEFVDNSLIEVVVEIQSNNFNLVNPSLNNHSKFARTLTLSIPSIFQYEFPEGHNGQELVLKKNVPFKLLKFNRTSKDWDDVIEIFEVDCNTYCWKLPSEAGNISNFSFNLSNFHIPNDNDIGVPCNELFESILLK